MTDKDDVAKIIDPDAFSATLHEGIYGEYWSSRRESARTKAAAVRSLLGGGLPLRADCTCACHPGAGLMHVAPCCIQPDTIGSHFGNGGGFDAAAPGAGR